MIAENMLLYENEQTGEVTSTYTKALCWLGAGARVLILRMELGHKHVSVIGAMEP